MTQRPVHAAKVQNINCAKYKTALGMYSGLPQKHAEEISAGEEVEAVEDAYGMLSSKILSVICILT